MGWSQGYRPKRRGEGWYNTMPAPLRHNPDYDDSGNKPSATRQMPEQNEGSDAFAPSPSRGTSARLPKR